MHWTSFPSKAESARQNVMLGFIFACSKFCLSCCVPCFPRLSKSKRRTTSAAPVCSISETTSRKVLPPVFAVITLPSTPKLRRASASFLPSTIIGVPFADSSARAFRIWRIFSCFSLRCVDKPRLPCHFSFPHNIQAFFSFFVSFKVASNRLKQCS
jgi:hypothetical protein